MNGWVLKKLVSDEDWMWKIFGNVEGTSADQN